MKIVGVAIYLADSACEIKKIPELILKTNGGEGVVRELYGCLGSENAKKIIK